jgi:hypothetical protein
MCGLGNTWTSWWCFTSLLLHFCIWFFYVSINITFWIYLFVWSILDYI